MKNLFYKRRFLLMPFGAAAFLSLVSYIVMQLWNYLLPGILHVGVITFWQAMGIFVLCKILFGFGGRGGKFGGGPWMRGRMEERFKHMTPEEKEQFKKRFGDRMCGPRGNKWGRDWQQDSDVAASKAE